MASTEKRGSEWRVRWREIDGTPRSRQCPTRKPAEQPRQQIEAERALGRDWRPEDPAVTPAIEDMFRAFLQAQKRQLKAGSVRQLDYALVGFL